MKNVFWLNNIIGIGGVEEFEYQLVKKYNYDITFYYNHATPKQLERLRKYCKVIKYKKGEQIYCDKFFTNYDISILDNVHAKEYIQVVHADFKVQAKVKGNSITPHLDDRFDKYLCVSNTVRDAFLEVTGLPKDKVITCYNPINLDNEEKRPTLLIGSFTRLSPEKGGERIKALVKELDTRKDLNYMWFIFTDSPLVLPSQNVIQITPRLNGITNMMGAMDIVAQLSDCEGWSYTVNQSVNVGTRLLYTPCPSFIEMGIDNDYNIRLEHNLSNIKEVADKLVKLYKSKKIKPQTLENKKDEWYKYLINSPKEYKLEENNTKVRVIKDYHDLILDEPKLVGEEYMTTSERASLLCEKELVKIL